MRDELLENVRWLQKRYVINPKSFFCDLSLQLMIEIYVKRLAKKSEIIFLVFSWLLSERSLLFDTPETSCLKLKWERLYCDTESKDNYIEQSNSCLICWITFVMECVTCWVFLLVSSFLTITTQSTPTCIYVGVFHCNQSKMPMSNIEAAG